MVLAMAALLVQLSAFPGVSNPPQPPPSPKVDTAVEAAKKAPDSTKTLPMTAAAGRPDAPVPKAATGVVGPSPALLDVNVAESSMSNVYLPPPAAFRPKIEPVERNNSRLWLALSATEHGSAAFDAWSTRRAISQGRAEADPVMRPFAHSAAIYGAIQVVPFGLDYVARRMQHSTGWARHVWWMPQSMATAAYLFSGSYNVAHTR